MLEASPDVFPYSYEESTQSAAISWHVPDDIKNDRIERLMNHQQVISLKENQEFVGQSLSRYWKRVMAWGYHTAAAAVMPLEVDGMMINSDQLQIGDIVPATIDCALTYDLIGYSPGLIWVILLKYRWRVSSHHDLRWVAAIGRIF